MHCPKCLAAEQTIEELVKHLRDAAQMFISIERNRQMPPEAQTLRQYVAKGKEIQNFLNECDL